MGNSFDDEFEEEGRSNDGALVKGNENLVDVSSEASQNKSGNDVSRDEVERLISKVNDFSRSNDFSIYP